MKKFLLVLGILGLIFSFSNQAQALSIVDTGPGPNMGGYGWGLDTSQWLGAKFSLSQSYSLTSIEGWIGLVTDSWSGYSHSGTGRISIYGDAGQIPNSSDLKYSQYFYVGVAEPSWQGITGLDWYLAPGSYWVAFEARIDSSLIAHMPHPSVNPLTDEAFTGYLDRWNPSPSDIMDIGVRILGNVDSGPVIPEPSSLLLLSLGGLLWKQGRKRFKI